MPERCLTTGAYVFLIDYQRYAVADIFGVDGTRVIHFGRDPLVIPGGHRPARQPTHTLRLNGQPNYWRQAAGIAVVADEDLTPFDQAKDVG